MDCAGMRPAVLQGVGTILEWFGDGRTLEHFKVEMVELGYYVQVFEMVELRYYGQVFVVTWLPGGEYRGSSAFVVPTLRSGGNCQLPKMIS